VKSTSGYKRTANAQCLVCGKAVYRRPSDLKSHRHVACLRHRAEAQRRSGITIAQQQALALGREKGTNHRTGYRHKASSKRKASRSHKLWCRAHPDLVAARGAKTRGELHYNWKGGSTRLNVSIRRMTEHRKWMDAVRVRDGHCACGSVRDLESHHIVPLATLVARYGVKNREDARACAALWELSNGVTKCQRCHYRIHRRRHYDD